MTISVKRKQFCAGIILPNLAILSYKCIVTLTFDLLTSKSIGHIFNSWETVCKVSFMMIGVKGRELWVIPVYPTNFGAGGGVKCISQDQGGHHCWRIYQKKETNLVRDVDTLHSAVAEEKSKMHKQIRCQDGHLGWRIGPKKKNLEEDVDSLSSFVKICSAVSEKSNENARPFDPKIYRCLPFFILHLCMKYEVSRSNTFRVNALQRSVDRRTDRQTDGRTDKVITIGLPHLRWRGPNKIMTDIVH